MGGGDLDGRVGLEGLGVLRGSCAGGVEGGGSGRGYEGGVEEASTRRYRGTRERLERGTRR